MTRLVFWDVDTQYDFMRADGKLYVPGAESIIPTLAALTRFAHEHEIPIVASADNHELSDPEISDSPDWKSTFPPHCLRGTPGQRKIPETALGQPLVLEPEAVDPAMLTRQVSEHRGDFLLHKRSLYVFANPNVPVLLEALNPAAVVLYGVATDFCNRWAIEGLLQHAPQTRVHVVTDAIRAIVPKEGERLIAEWERQGVRMVNSAQVIHGRVMDEHLPVSACDLRHSIG
jgi:nicotinamidase/pyrazinamidase